MGRVSSKPKHGMRVLELEAEAKKCLRTEAWAELPVEKLFVLNSFVISDTQVFVAWSTRGMLERATSAQNTSLHSLLTASRRL